MSSQGSTVRTHSVALRAMLLLTLVLGIVYPLAVTAAGQFAFPWQANGSMIEAHGADAASALIGQSFTDADGNPLPEWFQSRPSAAGDGFDGGASGGSNLGPENPELVAAIEQRRAEIASFNRVEPDAVPADALTASASGLDPQISPEYALLQVSRVAEARGINEGEVRALVESTIQGRDAGYLGERTVNVVRLNLALTKLDG